jgi:hypothetical protein
LRRMRVIRANRRCRQQRCPQHVPARILSFIPQVWRNVNQIAIPRNAPPGRQALRAHPQRVATERVCCGRSCKLRPRRLSGRRSQLSGNSGADALARSCPGARAQVIVFENDFEFAG